MPNEILQMFLKGDTGLYYHYKLMKWLDKCSLQEFRYFTKLQALK